MSDRYYGYRLRSYRGTIGGHPVELQFDKSLIVLNQARLLVDGEVLDEAKIFYGDKQLSATLADGTRIVIVVDSGMLGELTRAQLQQADGSWTDLTEGSPAT